MVGEAMGHGPEGGGAGVAELSGGAGGGGGGGRAVARMDAGANLATSSSISYTDDMWGTHRPSQKSASARSIR